MSPAWSGYWTISLGSVYQPAPVTDAEIGEDQPPPDPPADTDVVSARSTRNIIVRIRIKVINKILSDLRLS